MSFATHLFVTAEFSEESYHRFLGRIQNLYGEWQIEETVPVNVEPQSLTIHECWIKSNGTGGVRINLAASRHLKNVLMWGCEYAWHLRFESSSGREPLGVAVQLASLIIAMEMFPWSLVIDRDTALKDEPTEFRSRETVIEHIKNVIAHEFKLSKELRQMGILNEDGYFLLPGATTDR